MRLSGIEIERRAEAGSAPEQSANHRLQFAHPGLEAKLDWLLGRERRWLSCLLIRSLVLRLRYLP